MKLVFLIFVVICGVLGCSSREPSEREIEEVWLRAVEESVEVLVLTSNYEIDDIEKLGCRKIVEKVFECTFSWKLLVQKHDLDLCEGFPELRPIARCNPSDEMMNWAAADMNWTFMGEAVFFNEWQQYTETLTLFDSDTGWVVR